ncbi:MAG: hypothetical protein R2700_16070 [Solirubrobacterales bacterium]
MRRGLTMVVLAMALAAAPAFARAPTIDFLGNGYFCRGSGTGTVLTCGGIYLVRGGSVGVLFYRYSSHPIENISYRACSESPSGKVRCVPRRTRHKRRDTHVRKTARITIDRFRFTSSFPHRRPGIYKLTFRRDGKQWGQVVRLRVTP